MVELLIDLVLQDGFGAMLQQELVEELDVPLELQYGPILRDAFLDAHELPIDELRTHVVGLLLVGLLECLNATLEALVEFLEEVLWHLSVASSTHHLKCRIFGSLVLHLDLVLQEGQFLLNILADVLLVGLITLICGSPHLVLHDAIPSPIHLNAVIGIQLRDVLTRQLDKCHPIQRRALQFLDLDHLVDASSNLNHLIEEFWSKVIS